MDTGGRSRPCASRVLERQRLPRRVPDRRGARPGRADRDHRPRHRPGARARAADPRVRLEAGRTTTCSPRARSPATSSSAARSAPAATTPTGARCRTWRASATRSSRRAPTARFVVTKHAGTGGLVTRRHRARTSSSTRWAIRARYLDARLRRRLHQLRARARTAATACACRGVRGAPPTDDATRSRSATRTAGRRSASSRSRARTRSRRRGCAREIVWQRLALDGCEYADEEKLVEFVGANVCHAGIAAADTADPPEVVLRIGVKGRDRGKVDRFGTELVPLVTSGPPGRHRLRRRPARRRPRSSATGRRCVAQGAASTPRVSVVEAASTHAMPVPLSRIADARSGDKGEGSNVGVMARSRRGLRVPEASS